MKTTLCALLLLALSAAATAPAAARRAPQEQGVGAQPFDQFGDILVTDWLARLDSLAADLQANPTATGYVVAYMVPNRSPGWSLRRAQWARGYLVTGRGLEADRVQVFNAGYRDEPLYQFWVIPAGATLPLPPFDFGAALAREKKAYLFDRYAYYPINTDQTGIEYGYIGYLDEKGHYASFAEALRQDPAARGCIIAYATRRQRRGADRRLAARVKMGLLKNHALGADRVVALGGGLRDNRLVELWLVPPGAELPKPTPTQRPTRRRRR